MNGCDTVGFHRATEKDVDRLRRLVELYWYDASEIDPGALEPDEDGLFCPDDHFAFLIGPTVNSYLIRDSGKLAGFVIVGNGSVLSADKRVYDMTDLFVLRHLRRRGIGSTAASHAFDTYKGPWEVRVTHENVTGQAFWRKMINRYTCGNGSEEEVSSEKHHGPVFRFDSSRLATV